MASISERQHGLERIRSGYHIWVLAILLCPLSFISLSLIIHTLAAGTLATVLVTLFSLTFALSTRDGKVEQNIWQNTIIAIASAAMVYYTARGYDGAETEVAGLAALATIVQLVFFWIFYAWMTSELAGINVLDLGTGNEHHAHTPSHASLSFTFLLSLLLFGFGAIWHRGDALTPNPALWVVIQMVFIFGLLLLERLGFFERSAQEGNLLLGYKSHRRWILWALSLVLVASALALLGPHRTANPELSSHPGTGSVDAPQATSPNSSWEEALQNFTMAMAGVASSLPSSPRPTSLLWLLLLLLLLIILFVWVFSRSRVARWILAAVGWVLTFLLRLWQRLLALLGRLHRRATVSSAIDPEAPPWVRDPLLDIFEHPELLATLTTREVLLRTYHLFLHYSAMLGRGRGYGQTPLEFFRALALEGSARASLLELTWGYVGAMYGGTDVTLPRPEAVHTAWQHVAKTLAGALSPEELHLRKTAYLKQLAAPAFSLPA